MQVSRFFSGTHTVIFALVACFASFSAQGATPLPTMADPNLQTCLTEQANRNGWQSAEQVTQLDCSGRGVARLEGIEGLFVLAALDLSNNAIVDAWPLSALRTLTKLNLSGNRSIDIVQLRPVLDINWGLTSLGLNGIRVGAFSNLGALFNPQTGRPYDFVELDLGNTGLTDLAGNKSLDFLQPYASLTRLNVAGNGIDNIQALMSPSLAALAELDLSNNALVDLGPLMALHTLTKLNLSGNRSIGIVQVRPVLDINWGLTSLGLNGIRIGAFSNLGALFNPQTGRPYDFVELDLGNTGLTDFSGNKSLDFLQPYANLTRLNVAGNEISNIQVLPIFTRLAELDLSNNAIADAWPLSALRTLTKLNLSGNRSIDIVQVRPVLDMNWGLTSLGLNGIRVGAFSNLGALFNPQTGRPYDFVELDLGNTGLTDFSGNKSLDFLQPYANLTSLNVAGNGIDNIQVFTSPNPNGSGPNFAKLSELDISNNAIIDAWPLSALRTLTKLNLSGNRSIDIVQVRPVLDINWGLTSLGLNGIRIGAFSNLGALFNPQTGRPYDFVELDLGNSGLTDLAGNKSLDFLQPYANLTRLNVAGNGIDNIQVFWSQNLNGSGPNFAKLAELDLSSNAIVDVGPLTALRTLVALNLVDNTQIRCVDLDNLALALPQTDIRRPASCVGANVPPVANTGAPQTVNEGSAVTLAGSGIDSDGTIASYLWTQTAGPAVALVNANGATSTFTAPQVTADTVLAFQLTVTDNNGATATATTTVTVANVKGVDLVVTAASGSVTTVKRGSSFYFASTTRNAGDLSTSTSTTTGLYLSSDAAITAGDVRVGAVGIRGLGPGQAVNAVNRVTVPLTLAPGTYYLGAIADYTRRQPELDEANNSLAGIAIQVTQ